MERKEAAARVVENAVEHDADAPAVSFVEQAPKCRRSPQHGVDLFVVVRVIAMVRGGLEDGSEVECVNPQIRQVIEVFDDADQVAPLITVVRRRRSPLVQVPGLGHGQAPREPIGKDLVENRVANPVGGLRIEHRRLRRRIQGRSWRTGRREEANGRRPVNRRGRAGHGSQPVPQRAVIRYQ